MSYYDYIVNSDYIAMISHQEAIMTIKKQYEQIFALLEANKAKKVSTILPELMELMTAKQGGSKTFLKDDEGNVIAVYCYYHKQWEPLTKVEYGKKASNAATGLNTMCKVGANQWSKQQRDKKKAEQDLLAKVANGDIPADQVGAEMERIAEEVKQIIPREDGIGYASEADLEF